MIISIHQPEHMPWLGFFYKMKHSELFVILDSVQYRKNYFQNRNQIVTNGKPNYITVTVPTPGHISSTIDQMKLGQNDWRTGYLNKIKESYRKHPYFNIHFPEIEKIILEDFEYLEDLNMELINYFRDFLGIETPLVYSKDLGIDTHKDNLVFDICKKLGADTYISGVFGREYLNLDQFKESNIKVVYNEYTKYEYSQYKLNDFIPYMSLLDIAMNHDSEEANNILESSFVLAE